MNVPLVSKRTQTNTDAIVFFNTDRQAVTGRRFSIILLDNVLSIMLGCTYIFQDTAFAQYL